MGTDPTAELRINVPVEQKGFFSRLSSFLTGEPGGEPLEQPVAETDTENDQQKGIVFTKSPSGRWLWFARYSNKYLDDDYPVKEIIAEESHLNFVKEVQAGNLDYPELWLHHINGSAWGKSLWVGYDNGFALSAGYVYPEHEDLAAIMATKKDMLLSHGMDPESIIRDEENPHIILRHATKEISLLPASRAANKLTGFTILPKEDNMAQAEKGISQSDRETLIGMGVPEEWINRQEEANQKLAAIADQVLPSKDKGTENPVTEEVEQEPEAEPVETQAVDDEVVDAIIESIKALSDRVDELTSHVKAVEEEQDQLAGNSTKATRMSKLMSVIGSDEAQIDGRTSLAKSAPKAPEQDGLFFWQKEGWGNGN